MVLWNGSLNKLVLHLRNPSLRKYRAGCFWTFHVRDSQCLPLAMVARIWPTTPSKLWWTTLPTTPNDSYRTASIDTRRICSAMIVASLTHWIPPLSHDAQVRQHNKNSRSPTLFLLHLTAPTAKDSTVPTAIEKIMDFAESKKLREDYRQNEQAFFHETKLSASQEKLEWL